MADCFLSYATEDSAFARELAGGLRTNGFSVWHAELNLRIGDTLLKSIGEGLNNSTAGVLLISPAYLAKNWTRFEMDVLLGQRIEQGKKILPIWHGVAKSAVEAKDPGLAGIVALESSIPFPSLIARLTEVLAEGAPTRLVVPSYESPVWRFLQGLGEACIGREDGPATTVWELLIYLKEEEYPVRIGSRIYSREEILAQVALIIAQDPRRSGSWVSKEQLETIRSMCKKAGFDPEMLA